MKLRDVLFVLLISMVPLIELRGAIPVGAALGLEFYINMAVAIIGNLIPIPFILLFIPRILDFMLNFKIFRPIVLWLRRKAESGRKRILGITDKPEEITETGRELPCENAPNEKSEISNGAVSKEYMTRGVFLGLMLFVLLPIPGTGAWSGALVASLFGFSKMKSFFSISLGVIGCSVIMSLASYGILGFLSFLV